MINMLLRFAFQDVVRKVEAVETGYRDDPKLEVKIEDSGSLPVDKPFEVKKESAE